MRVKVLDFFSGCGGASCGFREAGMDIAFAVDCDGDAKRTYIRNFPEAHFECADIHDVDAADIASRVAKLKPAPVLFCGCAPCQPFTKHNTTLLPRRRDQRVPLIMEFARLVQAGRPDIVFVENVPGLQKLSRRAQPFGGFLNALEESGYHVSYEAVPLMRYGVPQGRRRLVLLASRHGPIELPPKTHGPGTQNPCYETVRDWIGDLPPISAGGEHATYPNHRAMNLSDLNLERIQATPEGGGHRDWPRRLRLKCHMGNAGYSDVYGRMWWDRPASGLTTRCISYSNGRFGHPEQDRAVSVREAACLQTFPRDFLFEGALESMARQIGNAVPVSLATVIGRHVVSHLERTAGEA